MTNETLHPEAEELTALLFKCGAEDQEERDYSVIQSLVHGTFMPTRLGGNLIGRTSEAAGDLYALIAESDYAKHGKVDGVSVISRCLWINQKHYPRG